MAATPSAAPTLMAPAGYRCLVIGPIGDRLAPVGSPENESYIRGMEVLGTLIRPACAKFGITAVRADDMRRRGDIPTQVYEALRDWDLVIADLTDENPNVMYELAIRHLTGKCAISIAQWGRLPFDVSHIRTEKYVHTDVGLAAGRALLESAISTVLSEDCDELPVTLIFQGATLAAPTPTQDTTHAAEEGFVQADGSTTTASESEIDTSALGDGGPAIQSPSEDLGYLDLLVEAEDAMPRLSEHVTAAGAAIEGMGNVFEQATTDINAADASGAGSARDRLLVAVRVAKHLDTAAERLETTAEAYASDMATVDRAISYILERLDAEPALRAGVPEFIDAIQTLRAQARDSERSSTELATSVSGLAKISKVLAAPASRVVRSLRRITATSATIEQWGMRIDGLPPMPDPVT
jgi:hypothetical protein